MATRKKQGKKSSKKSKTAKDQAKKFKQDQANKLGKKSSKKTSKKTSSAAKALDRNDSATARVTRAKKALEKSRNYAANGLAAQITETLLDELRALDKLWHKTPEAQQAVVIARLSDRVANAMGQAVQVLSAVGHKAVICNLFSVTFKDGVRATVTVGPGSDMRHELADYATRDVVLVLADPSAFMQGLEDIKPDADQPKLI